MTSRKAIAGEQSLFNKYAGHGFKDLASNRRKYLRKKTSPYEKFEQINGAHPWREASPDGYVDYPVRYRKGGRVLFFNFPLAKELELIPAHHAHQMNPQLERVILQTFALQIVNEYEQAQNSDHLRNALDGRYMATRYLQSQHKNKKGSTSGDGRSIWNGFVRTRKMIFDISSRGTGATILSPGFQESGKPIRTGDDRYGYASGLADVDEMLASAIMSEIFYREGIPTERCLVVIEFSGQTAIGVRTAPNLIRPAHIFRYLKVGHWAELKSAFDYCLKRQEENRAAVFPMGEKARYQKALENFARTYAKLAAVMEEEYIFNWLAWDGDNMLAEGALLDYGSIRQFAAKHNKYRYEDVDRFSTCLTEQRREARRLVQTFAQAVDFIFSKKKKKIEAFASHPSLRLFDQYFKNERQKRMLWRVGFTPLQIDTLITHQQKTVEAFQNFLNYFEDLKTKKGEQRVPDGVDHPPVFLVRHILRELPLFLLKNLPPIKVNSPHPSSWTFMPAEEFCRIMAASYVNRKDLTLTEYRREKATAFQECYQRLVSALCISAPQTPRQMLQGIAKRASVINYMYRSTGDALIWIVDKSLSARNVMKRRELQESIERFIESQVLIPGKWKPLRPEELKGSSQRARHLRRIQRTLQLYHEMI